jgi:hypothetical protein
MTARAAPHPPLGKAAASRENDGVGIAAAPSTREIVMPRKLAAPALAVLHAGLWGCAPDAFFLGGSTNVAIDCIISKLPQNR